MKNFGRPKILNKDNTVIFIGARGGSKRIPHKNIRLLNNEPLIAHTIKTSIALGFKTYLSSDSFEIGDIGQALGICFVQRPVELATDTSLDIEWFIHLLDRIEDHQYWFPKFIVLLRPTTPLRNLKVLQEAIEVFDPKYSSLKSVEPLKENIEKAYHIKGKVLEWAFPFTKKELISLGTSDPTIMPNQTYKQSYMANGYIDIMKSDFLLSNKDLYGDNVQAFVTPPITDIDDERDFLLAEWEIKNGKF